VRGATFDLSSTTTLNLSGSAEAVNLSGTTTAVSLGPNVPEPTPAMLALLGVAPLLLSRRRRAPARV
jgi:MYXO-CTERM domain-containing protein